jgi:predicted histidine transporter YuiF (NhaC family)
MGQKSKRVYLSFTVTLCCICLISLIVALIVQYYTSTRSLQHGIIAGHVVKHSLRKYFHWQETEDFQTHTWVAYAIITNVIDICISAAPFIVVYDLQIPRSRKARVVVAFALRLVFVSILHHNNIKLISLRQVGAGIHPPTHHNA